MDYIDIGARLESAIKSIPNKMKKFELYYFEQILFKLNIQNGEVSFFNKLENKWIKLGE